MMMMTAVMVISPRRSSDKSRSSDKGCGFAVHINIVIARAAGIIDIFGNGLLIADNDR